MSCSNWRVVVVWFPFLGWTKQKQRSSYGGITGTPSLFFLLLSLSLPLLSLHIYIYIISLSLSVCAYIYLCLALYILSNFDNFRPFLLRAYVVVVACAGVVLSKLGNL